MRDSKSPATLIGGLVLDSGPSSPNSEMPVKTRGMRKSQGQHASPMLQHTSPSSSTAPESSRTVPPRSSRAAGSSSRTAPQAASQASPSTSKKRPRNREQPRGDSDGSGDGSDDGAVEEEYLESVVDELVAILADTNPTPRECASTPGGAPLSLANTEQGQTCHKLKRFLTGEIEREPDVVRRLRREFSRQYCANRFPSTLQKRDAEIMRSLEENLKDQTRGRDVGECIADWRALNLAIEEVLEDYRSALSAESRQSLSALLCGILQRIFEQDGDLYEGRTRAVYAGEDNAGNPFRRLLSARARPIDFLGPLQRLPDHLLALQRGNIGDLIERYRTNGVGSSDPEQYNIVAQSLQGIWNRIAE